jgi:putative transposase
LARWASRPLNGYVPEDLDVHLIADNCCTHKHAKVRAWLAQRPRFHVHYTPTYASWLNQVERWFGIITQRASGAAASPASKS